MNFSDKTMGISRKSLLRHLISGWAIGISTTTLLILTADEHKPEWGNWWILKPLFITPLAAAAGMLSFYLQVFFQTKSTVAKVCIFITSLLSFVIALWMGIVLGFDGTLWN